MKKQFNHTITLDSFLKRLTAHEDEFIIPKAEVAKMKMVIKEKLGINGNANQTAMHQSKKAKTLADSCGFGKGYNTNLEIDGNLVDCLGRLSNLAVARRRRDCRQSGGKGPIH